MPPLVPLRVLGAGLLAMAAGRDPRDPPRRPDGGPDRIAVITPVRPPAHGLGTVCPGLRGQSQTDGPPRRVHAPGPLGMPPPGVRALGGGPPCAPAAGEGTRRWRASIIDAAPSGASRTAAHRAAHTPRARPRRQRRWGCCPLPESGGRSRPGTPVRRIPKPGIQKPPVVRGGAPGCGGPARLLPHVCAPAQPKWDDTP